MAQMQHHKQPIVTDILTTANKLHNQNDVETSIQWIPGHCDIPGNDRADELARQGTSVVAIPDFAMRYVSRYLGHDAIRIAILVYRVNQCLYLHIFFLAMQYNI